MTDAEIQEIADRMADRVFLRMIPFMLGVIEGLGTDTSDLRRELLAALPLERPPDAKA